MDETGNPKVFISYSWSSSDKVIELAERLMANGINIVLDKWDLKEGHDKYAFMEQSVKDTEIDKVLIICDSAYTEKADERKNGVGDETIIISPEVYSSVKQEKFIPIIFEVDADGNPYCPIYIQSRIHINLSSENGYEEEYEKLLRNIYNKPLYRKPALGSKPEWIENETVDLSAIRDLIRQTRGYTGTNKSKADFLMRKCGEEFIKALRSYKPEENIDNGDALLRQIDAVKPLRDLFLEYVEALIYNDTGISVVPTIIENIYNNTHDATGRGSYTEREFEFYDWFLWELFICITAQLLHYERFADLHTILKHTYFFKKGFHNSHELAQKYLFFRVNFRTIEDICKPKSNQPNLYTLAGEILLMREKKPIITSYSLTNADLVLYQMSKVFDFKTEHWSNIWFPSLYCYNEGQTIWTRLQSKEYCHKIMSLFGVSNIDKLKESISKCAIDTNIRYSGGMMYAPSILSFIKIEDIAKLD